MENYRLWRFAYTHFWKEIMSTLHSISKVRNKTQRKPRIYNGPQQHKYFSISVFHIPHLLFIWNLNLTGHLVFYLANLHREHPPGQWQTACLNMTTSKSSLHSTGRDSNVFRHLKAWYNVKDSKVWIQNTLKPFWENI